MSSVGKLIIGFAVLAISVVGALLIFSQQATTPLGQLNIGNMSEYTNNASAINLTTGLVTQSTSFGTVLGFGVIMVLMILCVLGAFAMFTKRGR